MNATGLASPIRPFISTSKRFRFVEVDIPDFSKEPCINNGAKSCCGHASAEDDEACNLPPFTCGTVNISRTTADRILNSKCVLHQDARQKDFIEIGGIKFTSADSDFSGPVAQVFERKNKKIARSRRTKKRKSLFITFRNNPCGQIYTVPLKLLCSFNPSVVDRMSSKHQ